MTRSPSHGSALAISLAFLLALLSTPLAAAPAPVVLLSVDGAIGPASADYVSRGIARAARDGAQLAVLRIDTPGGLDTAMRVIIKAILASPLPVATYVAPSGARAASAGTYILYASHVAAMAPGTNLGAATPVQIGGSGEPDSPGIPPAKSPEPQSKDGTGRAQGKEPAHAMTRKQVNDAAAYIRGLAQLRGRNMEWAEQAVREAVSLSAQDALRLHVVDYMAADLPALLQQLDGKRIAVSGRELVLHTAGAPVVDYRPDWRVRLLATITDPSIALLLMTVGIYGLIFELMNPGSGVPGVLGGICLLLGLYALQLLPVNYAGLALILLGLGFMVAEAFLPSFGVIGVGGIVAFVAGALILIDTDLPGFGIPLSLIVAMAITSALLLATLVGIALKTRRRTVVSGESRLIGHVADVLTVGPDGAWARVGGEIWQVDCPAPLQRMQKVKVVSRNGLVLQVAPLDGTLNGAVNDNLGEHS